MYQTCHFGYEGHTHKCCSSIMRSVEGGERGTPNAHFCSRGGRGGTVNDHSIMIMHWGGGGRSHNNHLITLMIFGQELQKKGQLVYIVPYFGQQYVLS